MFGIVFVAGCIGCAFFDILYAYAAAFLEEPANKYAADAA
jgi:hypothetical protein